MKRLPAAVIGTVTVLASATANAQTADAVFGLWLNAGNGGHIAMEKCGEKLCAKVVSIPNNEPPDGPKTDKNNPDESLRGRPIVGMLILDQAYKADEKSWKGTIYNPEDGKTYDVTVTSKSANEVELKGCLLTFLCRTQAWTRLP